MDIELRNDRIPRNPFDRQFLDMSQSVQRQQDSTCITLHDLYHCICMHAVSVSFQQVQQSRLLCDQACSSFLIKCFISGAMEPKEKKARATTLYMLGGVAKVKQFQLLCSIKDSEMVFCVCSAL